LAPHSGSLGRAKIGIAVGSRGIYGIKDLVRVVVDFIKDAGPSL
jgi:hypothetical protein